MLLFSPIKLKLVNAVRAGREFKLLFTRVACVLLLYSGLINHGIGVIWGLFHFQTKSSILAYVKAYIVKVVIFFLLILIWWMGTPDHLAEFSLTLTIIKLTSKSPLLNSIRNLSYRKICAPGEKGLAPLKIYSQITPTSQEVELIKKLTQLEAAGNEILVWAIIDRKTPQPVFRLSSFDSRVVSPSQAYNDFFAALFSREGLAAIKEQVFKDQSVLYQGLSTQGWINYDLCLVVRHKDKSLSSRQQSIYTSLIKADYQNSLTNRNIKIKVDQVLTELAQKATPVLITPAAPVKVYYLTALTAQSGKLKWKIRYDNRHKCGIYRWYNRVNGKSYIGSSRDLESRFNYYFNLQANKPILVEARRPIVKALLRHTFYNFNLEILTYCSPPELLAQEKYYIQHYQPEYNVIKPSIPNQTAPTLNSELTSDSPAVNSVPVAKFQPVSLIPYSASALALTTLVPSLPLSSVVISPDLPPLSLPLKSPANRKHTEVTKAKISLARQQRVSQPIPGIKVQVEDLLEQTTIIYPTIRAAAQALQINDGTLSRRLRSPLTKPYQKRYVISKVN